MASGVPSSIGRPKCRGRREKVKDFAASADLKETMMKAGVLDTPTIYFLESID
jgi:hypothetical protein